jgi:tRNA threonylcarbamoyladenosine biosynthesis protein TsaE
VKIKTKSPKETEAIAEKLIAGLDSVFKKNGTVVLALDGDLGAGKTTFTKGIFSALKIKGRAVSPTFIIVRKKKPGVKNLKNVFHMDAYRIKNLDELEAIGFFKMIKEPMSLVVVEWASNIRKAIPKGAIWVGFWHGEKEGERIIEIKK